jgi:transaldolase / glucose-6-phosphate isomerase
MQPTGVLETAKATNPLKALLSYGQSMWLDYIRRDLITSGSLKKMIDEDGLRGMTSNPAIFEKAIADSSLYDDMLKTLASRMIWIRRGAMSRLRFATFQDAADVLRPVYESSKFRDGYVSLEVSPLLALKTQETIDEARRLWKAVNRENVMIKIPGRPRDFPRFGRRLAKASMSM